MPEVTGTASETHWLDQIKPIIINLRSRQDRLHDSLAELSRAFNRTVGRDDVHLIRPPRFDEPSGFSNVGFRSNLEAHLAAARLSQDNSNMVNLILEDDIAISSAWATAADGLLSELNDRPWQIANLGYLDHWGEVAAASAQNEETGPRWLPFRGKVNGLHAYLLHRSVLDRWIAHLDTVAHGEPGDQLLGPMPSDGALNTFTWVEPHAVRLLAVPNLVGSRPTRSDISPRGIDRLPVVRALAERARRQRFRRRRDAASRF